MLLRSGVRPRGCVSALRQEIERTLREAVATA
jgi:hypothetical protein